MVGNDIKWATPAAAYLLPPAPLSPATTPNYPLEPHNKHPHKKTQVVPEADRKAYTYKGVCIARANKGPRSWFKLYNVFPDAGGFIQHFPL